MSNTRFFSRWVRDEKGSVTVEFVMVLPIFLGFLAMTFAAFHAFLEFSRTSKAIYTVSDIVSRHEEMDQARVDQLQQLYGSFTSGNGAILRVSRLEFVAKPEDADEDDVTSDGFETEEGFYEVAWSMPSPALPPDACDNIDSAVCPSSTSLRTALSAQDLSKYDLPGLGDGAHIILVDGYMPYRGPIGGLFGLIPDFDALNWQLHNFIWPRHINGLSLLYGDDS